MICEEFRDLFVLLLRQGPPPDFPAEAYRQHFVACVRCQTLLSLQEVEEAISDYSGAQPPRLSPERLDVVIRRARRGAILHKVLTRGAAAGTVVLLLVVGLFALSPGTRPAEAPVPAPIERVDVATYAASLRMEGFSTLSAIQARTSGSIVIAFVRENPSADQYEQARKIYASGILEGFPEAQVISVLISQHGQSLLRIRTTPEALRAALAVPASSPEAFLIRLDLFFDAEGRANRLRER